MIEVTNIAVSFRDDRGTTTNVLTKPINVAIIRTRDGAVRGNHVHREQGHWEYVVEGKIEVARPTPAGNQEVEIVHPGEMVFTPPGVAHAFRSIGESVILHIVTVPLEGDFYERDTEKVAVL